MADKTGKMSLDTSEPLYIVELGTGSGKFSYYMLKALEEMSSVCEFPLGKIVYVMTDFTENNFNFWRDHPALKVGGEGEGIYIYMYICVCLCIYMYIYVCVCVYICIYMCVFVHVYSMYIYLILCVWLVGWLEIFC